MNVVHFSWNWPRSNGFVLSWFETKEWSKTNHDNDLIKNPDHIFLEEVKQDKLLMEKQGKGRAVDLGTRMKIIGVMLRYGKG